MKAQRTFEIGDRVAYSQAFLRSIGANRDISDLRGTVTRIIPGSTTGTPQRIEVAWDHLADKPDPDERVNRSLGSNLARVGSAAFSG